MVKKFSVLVMMFLVVVSLLTTSCETKSTDSGEEVDSEDVVATEQTQPSEVGTTPEQTTTPASDEPKYGGRLIICSANEMVDFDEIIGFFGTAALHPMRLTNEELWIGDWTKGPAGTGATDWVESNDRWDLKTGSLAESWDFSQLAEGIMVFNIRQGVHWALNTESEASQLVGGRELTAHDVAFSLTEHFINPQAYFSKSLPRVQEAEVTAIDKWTVEVKVPPGYVEEYVGRVTDCIRIFPPEIVEKYGNMSDWRNSVGTGPFILTNFVSGSSATLTKNPNYWDFDPIGPGKGNRLPYIDQVSALIISDQSTREAAIRTGGIDQLGGFSWENGPLLMKQAPEIRFYEAGRSGAAQATGWRVDQPPFNDIRIRRALMMAIDWEGIKMLYGGDPEILTWPIGRTNAYKDAYLGLDDPEMPESIKELYVYNPEKAKTLITEAGYPDGFKTNVICHNDPTVVDYFSVLADSWSKVGVDLEIKTLEFGAWNAVMRSRDYDQLLYGSAGTIPALYRCLSYSGEGLANVSLINDPHVEEVRKQMVALAVTNPSEADKMHKELMKYVLDQAWAIPYPSPVSYNFWWPWLKNYNGENSLGYFNFYSWTKYAQIDQDLKKSMGY